MRSTGATRHYAARMRSRLARDVATGFVHWVWGRAAAFGAIDGGSRRARRFAGFGEGSRICFPVTGLMGEQWIRIGSQTLIAEYATVSAGMSSEHVPRFQPLVTIGDRCVFGRATGIVANWRIDIGDDVWTGHHVYITDHNHGYEDLTIPPGRQIGRHARVTIRDGAWLGHGSIVLPGVTVGRNTVVGAGSVVTTDLPDHCVAAGNPAQVLRRYVTGKGWVRSASPPAESPASRRLESM